VSTTPGNPGNLLEFKNPRGNPGNLLEFYWSSWKFLCKMSKIIKYSLQKYETYRHQMCFFKFQMHQNPFSAGALPGVFQLFMGISALRRRLKQGKDVLDFS